ncbi:MAG: hypothetical protein Fur005_35790 [Roseiflexaceae bacterium]
MVPHSLNACARHLAYHSAIQEIQKPKASTSAALDLYSISISFGMARQRHMGGWGHSPEEILPASFQIK